MVNRTINRLVAVSLAAATALTLSACGKGSSSASSGDTNTLKLWTHNAGNDEELASINAIVTDYNASQTQYKVEVQAFPQDSYNQSVTAAAASKNLPCILDVDAPNVPNWAWANYLSPLTGLDDTLSKFLPSTVGRYDDKIYSYGYYDVVAGDDQPASPCSRPTAFASRPSTSPGRQRNSTRRWPRSRRPERSSTRWTWAPAPPVNGGPTPTRRLLQSFGGDLINRTDYKSADGVLNGDAALAWATWFRSMATDGYMPAKSGADAAADFANGKSAILYSGQWSASNLEAAFGDDVLFLPPVDFGAGPKVGGGSWQWAVSSGCGNQAGAMDYMKFAAQDKYVASVATATFNIPATDAAAATVAGYEAGGKYDIFRQYSKAFAEIRPATPGYPFIATEFTKTAQDILNGADPQAALDTAVANIDANQKSNNYFAAS